MVRPEATGQGPAQFGELLAQLAASQVGQQRRSVVPATSAISIERPDTPSMSVATLESLMPASWQHFVQADWRLACAPGQALAITG